MFSKEQFTTVTPLSKALAMVVFIILPFAAFFLGMNFGQQSLPPVTTSVVTITDNIRDEGKIPQGCTTLDKFVSASWIGAAGRLYEEKFLIGFWGEDFIPDGESLLGDGAQYFMGCFLEEKNLFVFSPPFSEEGCERIFSYDIESDVLHTVVDITKPNGDTLCVSNFEMIQDDVIELSGGFGGGGYGTVGYSHYYVNEGRVETYRRCDFEVGGETNCEGVSEIYQLTEL